MGVKQNNAITNLVGNLSSSGTSFSVKTGEGDMFPTSGELTIRQYSGDVVVKREIIAYTLRSGDVFSGLTRASEECVQDDSQNPKVVSNTPRSFSAGAEIYQSVTSRDLEDIKTELATKLSSDADESITGEWEFQEILKGSIGEFDQLRISNSTYTVYIGETATGDGTGRSSSNRITLDDALDLPLSQGYTRFYFEPNTTHHITRNHTIYGGYIDFIGVYQNRATIIYDTYVNAGKNRFYTINFRNQWNRFINCNLQNAEKADSGLNWYTGGYYSTYPINLNVYNKAQIILDNADIIQTCPYFIGVGPGISRFSIRSAGDCYLSGSSVALMHVVDNGAVILTRGGFSEITSGYKYCDGAKVGQNLLTNITDETEVDYAYSVDSGPAILAFQETSGSSTFTRSYTHSLGKIPTLFECMVTRNNGYDSQGFYDDGTYGAVSNRGGARTDCMFILDFDSGDYFKATVSNITSTGFDITYTEVGSCSAVTYNILIKLT